VETWRNRDMTQKHGDMDMETWKTENRNRSPRWFSLICLPFAHHANWSLLFVCLLTKKETELSICKRTNRTKWTKWTKRTKRDLPVYEYQPVICCEILAGVGWTSNKSFLYSRKLVILLYWKLVDREWTFAHELNNLAELPLPTWHAREWTRSYLIG
jgi:hypothetical protein